MSLNVYVHVYIMYIIYKYCYPMNNKLNDYWNVKKKNVYQFAKIDVVQMEEIPRKKKIVPYRIK